MTNSRSKLINSGDDYRIRITKMGKLIIINVYSKKGGEKPLETGHTTLDEPNAINVIEEFLAKWLQNDSNRHVKREKVVEWIKTKQAERKKKVKEEYDYYVVNTFIRDGDNTYNLKSLNIIPKGEEPYAYLNKTEIEEVYHKPEAESGGYFIEGMCRYIEFTRAEKISKKEFDLIKKYI